MLPGNGGASTQPVYSAMLPPDNRVPSALHDYEMGGVALQDPSQGLQVQPWECWLQGDEVRIRPVGDSASVVLFAAPGIQSLSFTFDRNMNPTVAYMQDGVCRLWWYDSTIPGMTTSTFPGATQPRLTHDDKREVASPWADVILAYVREGSLYYRLQRDRFGVEYLLATGITRGQLRNVGMNRGLRLQFEIR